MGGSGLVEGGVSRSGGRGSCGESSGGDGEGDDACCWENGNTDSSKIT